MLQARIKGNNRKEIKKTIWGTGKNFKIKDETYKIDPTCIYKGAYGLFFKSDCIDYVQGIEDPIDYYGMAAEEVSNISRSKNYNTISSLIFSWIRNALSGYDFYNLIIGCILIGLMVINLILLYLWVGE